MRATTTTTGFIFTFVKKKLLLLSDLCNWPICRRKKKGRKKTVEFVVRRCCGTDADVPPFFPVESSISTWWNYPTGTWIENIYTPRTHTHSDFHTWRNLSPVKGKNSFSNNVFVSFCSSICLTSRDDIVGILLVSLRAHHFIIADRNNGLSRAARLPDLMI